MKTIGLFGVLAVLLLFAFDRVAGTASEAAQGPDPRITTPAAAVIGGSVKLPAELAEYVFLHQARPESIPVNAMAGVTTCPE